VANEAQAGVGAPQAVPAGSAAEQQCDAFAAFLAEKVFQAVSGWIPLPALNAMVYSLSYLAGKMEHLDPIWQPCIGSLFGL
jgi:hypothetical protein